MPSPQSLHLPSTSLVRCSPLYAPIESLECFYLITYQIELQNCLLACLFLHLTMSYQGNNFPYLALHSQLLAFHLAHRGYSGSDRTLSTTPNIHFICFYTYPLTMKLSGCFTQQFPGSVPFKRFLQYCIFPALVSFLKC